MLSTITNLQRVHLPTTIGLELPFENGLEKYIKSFEALMHTYFIYLTICCLARYIPTIKVESMAMVVLG